MVWPFGFYLWVMGLKWRWWWYDEDWFLHRHVVLPHYSGTPPRPERVRVVGEGQSGEMASSASCRKLRLIGWTYCSLQGCWVQILPSKALLDSTTNTFSFSILPLFLSVFMYLTLSFLCLLLNQCLVDCWDHKFLPVSFFGGMLLKKMISFSHTVKLIILWIMITIQNNFF